MESDSPRAPWPKVAGTKAKWKVIETVGAGTYGPGLHGYDHLILHVSARGRRHWSYKYRFPKGRPGGPNREISFPFERIEETLKKLADFRLSLSDGTDPMAARAHKTARANPDTTFRSVATHVYTVARPVQDQRDVFQKLEKDVFPVFGDKQMRDVTIDDVRTALDRPILRGSPKTTKKLLPRVSQVFKWAISEGICDRNYAADLSARYPKGDEKHYKMVPLRLLPAFLSALDAYEVECGSLVVRCALELKLLTGSRSKPVFLAGWSEFYDLWGQWPAWTCPSAHMKTNEVFSSPLSRQSVAVMARMKTYTLGYFERCEGYVFPRQGRGADSQKKHLSDGAFTAAMEAMGFKGLAQPHGFRGLFKTLCAAHPGFTKDNVERCLAHKVDSDTTLAYDHHDYYPERAEIVQWYADLLDRIRAAGTVEGILHPMQIRRNEIDIRERGDWDLYVATARRVGVIVPEGV